jgi:IS5 family transposase
MYNQPNAKGSRSPFPFEVMLQIHLLQQWFTLSDPLMDEMLIDTYCFRRFAGIGMNEERIPDETTILSIRHFLEEHRIAEQILEGVNKMLSEQGMMLKEGAILDATIINTLSSALTRAKPVCPRGTGTSTGIEIRKCTPWLRGSIASLGCNRENSSQRA